MFRQICQANIGGYYWDFYREIVKKKIGEYGIYALVNETKD
jgi:hypothetical protein